MLSRYQIYVCLKNISPTGILLIVVILFETPSLCADVSWNVRSDPALFYSSVYLECEIPNDFNNCDRSIKQWLGGRNYGSLCYGTDCRGSKKYAIMESTCSYVLEIKRFSEDDFNCEYTCSYGITGMRKKLTEEVGRFRYYPEEHEVIDRSYMQGKNVVLAVNLTKVFPMPQNCSISTNGRNDSDIHVVSNWTQPSFFYEVRLMMKLPVTLCKGVATIYCSWDSTDTMKVKSINYNCEDMHYIEVEKKNQDITEVIVGVLAAIILSVLVATLYLWKMRLCCLKPTTPNGEHGNGSSRECQSEITLLPNQKFVGNGMLMRHLNTETTYEECNFDLYLPDFQMSKQHGGVLCPESNTSC